jgi:anti-sigma B factor antagonist
LLGGLPVVTPPAEIDIGNAGRLREALVSASSVHATIIVDMTATEFCDSSVLSALAMAVKRAWTGGGELRVVMGAPRARRIFKATGVNRVVRMFENPPEAVAARSPAPRPPHEWPRRGP